MDGWTDGHTDGQHENIIFQTGMDSASSTRAAENQKRLKGIVAKSAVLPQTPCKVMGLSCPRLTHNIT